MARFKRSRVKILTRGDLEQNGGQGSRVNILTWVRSMAKRQGSKAHAGKRGSLDLLHRAVRVSQRCCNSLATFSSKVVVVKTVVRQADEGLGGQYMDSGPVQDQASKFKRPRSSTRAGKRSSLYVLHLAARASQCCCNSFATFSLKAVVLETVVRQAEEGLGGSIY